MPLRLVLGYEVAFVASILATLISGLFRSALIHGRTAPFLAAVAISAWYGGLGPGLLATGIGALALDYIFLGSPFSFSLAFPTSAVPLSEFILVGTLISFLSGRLRAAQRSAETNLALLDTLLASAPVGMGFLDRDLRVVRLNEPLAQFDGVLLRASLGRGVQDIVPRFWETLEPLARSVLTTGKALVNYEVIEDVPATGGQPRTWLVSYYPVRVAQRGVIGIGNVVVDVTERTHAAETRAQLVRAEAVRAAVERERARLAAILQRAPSGIIFVAADSGTLLFNQRATEILGRPLCAEGGTLQYVDQLTRPDGRTLTGEELPSSQALRGKTPADQDLVIVRPDGRRIPVLVSAAPVRGVAGEVQGAVVMFQDISTLKELEGLREEFTSAVAHELRTPITVIKGQAQIALMRGAQEEQLRRTLQTIDQQVDRIAQTIEDLLTVMRIRPGLNALRLERFDLTALVRDVVEQTARLQPSDVFRVETDGQLVVDADRELVGEVVRRLLENAWRYSPIGERIEVVARRQDNTAVVEVTDHGVEIPVDRQPHVFDPFYEPVPPGEPGYTGIVSLGLYLSKEILNAHLGRIWLTSAPGKGSTVAFSLPLAQGDA